ncbi:2-oxo-4-hydroxy-4-carboxy-5-ureidoimidazoline decarboxylase [Alphaproteobacteria bacterium]|nr:2-oxo-4-hydroxy-4-carboxy-5-ureidoimidazoline decarboxylase [Alphaproteobacteria bacterium]
MAIKPAPHLLSRADFIAAFGGIYEHSPWVAERLFDAGLTAHDADLASLARRMAEIVDAAGYDKQMALLCAHPELAGKLAIAGSLTAESTAEQASAKLDQCNAEEFAAFQDLNDRYGKNFGHPFIIAVRGLDRATILAAFGKRVAYSAETEFATALGEVHKIAQLRLEQLSAE